MSNFLIYFMVYVKNYCLCQIFKCMLDMRLWFGSNSQSISNVLTKLVNKCTNFLKNSSKSEIYCFCTAFCQYLCTGT